MISRHTRIIEENERKVKGDQRNRIKTTPLHQPVVTAHRRSHDQTRVQNNQQLQIKSQKKINLIWFLARAPSNMINDHRPTSQRATIIKGKRKPKKLTKKLESK